MFNKDNISYVYDEQLYQKILREVAIKPIGRADEGNVINLFNAREKVYPDGSVTIKKLNFVCQYKSDGYELVDKPSKIKPVIDDDTPNTDMIISVPKVQTPDDINKKTLENIQRARNTIYDIAISNEWNYFITLTYSAEKCDRYSFVETSKKVRKYLNNFKNYHKIDCPNFKYLIVHEMHKDGAYHYHGLIYLDDDATMSNSGKRTKKDQPIYNWTKWTNGWSTATKIDNVDACCNYITKYVTKSISEEYTKGQRRYYYSQNCKKPVINRYIIDDNELVNYDCTYKTDISSGYETDLATMIDARYGIDIKEI